VGYRGAIRTTLEFERGLSSFGDEVAMARDNRQTERIVKRLLQRVDLID